MKNNILLIIGAGLSAPFGLPTDYGFFETEKYKSKLNDNKAHYFLEKVFEKLYSPGGPAYIPYKLNWKLRSRLETVWSEIAANKKSPKIVLDADEVNELNNQFLLLALEEKKHDRKYYHHYYFNSSAPLSPYYYLFEFAEWELRKIIVKIYSEHCWQDSHVELFRNYLDHLRREYKKICIVNFNYDLFIEKVLEGKPFHYVGIEDTKTDDSVAIIRPHGSVAWSANWDHSIIEAGRQFVSVDEIGYRDGAFKQHCIVGLTYDKSEYGVDDVTAPPNMVSNYHHIFFGYTLARKLEAHFEEADDISIIGYSFPTADSYFRGIVTRAIRKRNASAKKIQNIKWLLTDEKRPGALDRSTREQLAEELFGIDRKNIDLRVNGWEVDIQDIISSNTNVLRQS